MLIEKCMSLPSAVGSLPEVWYPYEVRAWNLRRRAIEIQDAIDKLGRDYAFFMNELHSHCPIEELEEAGL